MNKAFNFLIIAALILGVICVILITKYVDARVNQAREGAPSKEMVLKEVLVAKAEITVGSKFTSFNTEVRSMPENFVPETSVLTLEALNDKVALFTIPEEDMILTSKIGTPSQLPKASTVIESGKRLVTIGVDDLSAAGYTIKNGDFIDLLGIFTVTEDMLEREEMPVGNTLGVTFLQRVLVFDIVHGEDGSPNEADDDLGDDEVGSRRMARGTNVTFVVTPQEAQIILAAESAAEELYMLLRRYDDTAIAEQPSELHERIAKRVTGDLAQEIVETAPVEAPVVQPKKIIF